MINGNWLCHQNTKCVYLLLKDRKMFCYINFFFYIKGDLLYMAVFFLVTGKKGLVQFLVCACTVAHTRHVTFYRVQDKTRPYLSVQVVIERNLIFLQKQRRKKHYHFFGKFFGPPNMQMKVSAWYLTWSAASLLLELCLVMPCIMYMQNEQH